MLEIAIRMIWSVWSSCVVTVWNDILWILDRSTAMRATWESIKSWIGRVRREVSSMESCLIHKVIQRLRFGSRLGALLLWVC
jgi:hypothetical protein